MNSALLTPQLDTTPSVLISRAWHKGIEVINHWAMLWGHDNANYAKYPCLCFYLDNPIKDSLQPR